MSSGLSALYPPEMATILSLPNEVLYSIFGRLSVSDLLRCVQVARHFHNLVGHDVLLQYQAELTLHGMMGVPHEDVTVAAALSMLKCFGESFHLATFHCAPLTNPGSGAGRTFTSFLSPEGSLVHFVRQQGTRTECVVDQLPSAVRGLQARRWTVQLPTAANIDILAVDVSQDVTVSVESRNDGEVIIHFLTATEGKPHPLAITPVIHATWTAGSMGSPDAYYHIQSVRISGTHVGWVIPGFSSGLDTLQCWNWQTGRMVWEQQYDGLAGYTFLDARYVLTVLHHEQEASLCIYDFVSQTQKAESHSTLSSMCTLGLPRTSTGHVQVVHVQSRTPTHPRDAMVIFKREPTSTAVVLHLIVGPDDHGETSDLVLMIPYKTLRNQVHEAMSSSCEIPMEHYVEWDKWGPSGSVMLNQPRMPHISQYGGWFVPSDVWLQSFGSRLAMLLCDSPDMTSGCVVTVDIHPWAAKCARRHRRDGDVDEPDDTKSRTSSPGDGPSNDILKELAMVPRTVVFEPTTLRHAVQVGPRIVFPAGRRPSRIITTHDGFAIAYDGEDLEVGLHAFTV